MMSQLTFPLIQPLIFLGCDMWYTPSQQNKKMAFPNIFCGKTLQRSGEVGCNNWREEDEISLFKKYQYNPILKGRR
jgi:hypothetical protein